MNSGSNTKWRSTSKAGIYPTLYHPTFLFVFSGYCKKHSTIRQKHSGVRHFEVRLRGTPNEVHLTVNDCGAGFDMGAAKAGRGLGLISMEERLKILNGTLSIEPQLERGTRIHAFVPIAPGVISESTA